MEEQTPVMCTECEDVYTARKRGDGALVVPTVDGEYQRGSDAFAELDGEAVLD